MTDNPFVYDRPLPPGELIDRRAELDTLLALARGGQSARLAAPRRFGKTTLLGALAEAAWHAHELIPAYVDFSGVTSLADVAVRLDAAYARGLERSRTRGLWRSLRRRAGVSLELGVPGLARATASLGAGGPSEELARVHELLDVPRAVHARTGERCLVILDEFQDLLTAESSLDGILRSHLQHHSGIASYVFVGSQPSLMRALFGDRRRPLFEQARGVELGRLADADLADHVEAALREAGREPLVELVDSLVRIADGHPQRAMLLAHFLFEQADGDPDALPGAVEAALHEASDSLEQTWRGLSRAERRVLGAVAKGERRLLGNAALAYTGLGKGSQASVRDALARDGHLELTEDGARFVDPLLPLWLATPRGLGR